MYCCSSEWIQFLGVTMKSCRFLQSKRQTSSKPYYQLLRWDSDCHLDGQLHTTPGEEDRLWLAMLVSHLHQLPPAAEGLVTLTMLVSVQQKPKDYFKLTSLCCFESQKSGKLQAQTQKLVLWDHLLMWEIGSSPEKILSVVFSTVSWTKLSLLFVFNNSSVNWKLQGIFPHVLTHCLHPLGCRSVTVGMAHALLTVLSTSFSRKQELKAFWLGKKKKKTPKQKRKKRNLATLSWSKGEGGSITGTRIHKWLRIQIPTYTMAPEVPATQYCLQAFWRQVGFLDKWFCCFQWLHHKEGWPLGLGGLLAAAQSCAPIFPGSITSPSTIISSRAQSSSRRSM